ncbi:TonB-dependent receptor domain-containing protein [Flavobacterium sp. 3HN19-14]|uniref:TonB-dependent receptor domain-containing protein n=1 Tax=Flavobacterium sp. 3HN19-14 TaxID=3448133 RepID=UPI003EE28F3E
MGTFKRRILAQNKVVTQLKLRGSWGITGNDDIFGREYPYAATISGGNNYPVGTDGTVVIGNGPNTLANPDLQWEETTQTDFGLETTLFNSLNLEFGYFHKKTTGIIKEIIIPGYVGANSNPLGNVGEMTNSGFEFSMSYRKSFGDLKMNLSGNFSTLKNEVTSISPAQDFYTGASIQSARFPITRTEVGHPYMQFYGLVTQGIFQNQAQIDAHVNSAGTVIQPDAVPGDFIYKDLNDDGKINENDRDYLGNPIPDFTYGITLNLEYKGIDLLIFGQGVGGNQLYKGLRRLDLGSTPNYQTAALGRWTGEGSSNTYPRITDDDTNKNFTTPSAFYIEDGDYFRIKMVQLGYSLPKSIISKAGLERVRLYVTGENLFTFTKYTGYDPEIGNSGTDTQGIDRGYYPQAKSYMFGVNLQF